MQEASHMPVTDYTDEWVSLFRENGKGMGLPDSSYLQMALAFGKPRMVDNLSSVGRYYQKPELKTVRKLLKSMQKNHQENSVSPGEAVGIIAAHSISEVYTQTTLRTFHYAGLVGTLAPGNDIEKVIGTTSTMPTRHVVALKPEYRMNLNEAKRLANKLTRWKLEQLFHVNLLDNKDSAYDTLIKDIDEFPENEKYVDLPDNHPIILKRKKAYGSDFNPKEDMYDPYNYSPEYQDLLNRRNIYLDRAKEDLVNRVGENEYGYSIDVVPKYSSVGSMGENKELPPFFMTLEELKPHLERSLVDSTGERKSSSMKGWSFAGISIINNGDKITITIPKGVFPRKSVWMMALNFSQVLKQLEFCSGCGGILSVFSKGEFKDRSIRYEVDESIDQTAKEHYASILSSINVETLDDDPEFFDEDYLRTNPVSEKGEIEEVQNNASGMLRVEPAPSELYFISVERNANWRNCRECGGGWWNTAAGVAQVKDYRPQTLEQMLGADSSEITDVATLVFESMTSNEDLSSYPFAWKDHQFEPPGPNINYSQNATMIDAMPANPLPGEYYLQVAPLEEITTDNNWKGSVYCAGHFSHLVGQYDQKGNYQPPTFLEADSSRCLTTNLHQIEKTLGIEAARQMTFQVLSQLYSGGQWLQGFQTRIDDRHFMLLADTFTNTGRLKGAPASNASISGVNATKGIAGNKSAVLSMASYERPLDVLMKKTGAAAIMGIVDPLDEPISAQIVGTEMKIGSGTHPDSGRYDLTEIFDSRLASSVYDMSMERLVGLFMGEGRSVQAAENLMGLPETHEMYPKRIFESDEYKEAIQEALDAKLEFERLHGRIVEVLYSKQMLDQDN